MPFGIGPFQSRRTSVCHLHLFHRIYKLYHVIEFWILLSIFLHILLLLIFCIFLFGLVWFGLVCHFFFLLEGLLFFIYFVLCRSIRTKSGQMCATACVRVTSLICSNTGFDDSCYKKLSRWFPLIVRSESQPTTTTTTNTDKPTWEGTIGLK